MKRKSLIYTIVILIGSFYLTGYLFADEAKKGEINRLHKTVVIHEYQGVTPETLIVKPGTTVIWVNLAAIQAEIIFLDKEVVDAADCPVYFFVGRDGTYETHEMCAGYTASLCFQEKGRYDYIVKASRTVYGEEKEYLGTIWIR